MKTLKLIKKYEKYPEYKDSGVEWFGCVPKNWKVMPLRSVLIERKDKNKKLVSDNILSVMKDVGVIRYADKGDIGNKSSDRPENYKIVHPGDIVLNSMNLVIGSVGQAKELGVTSSVYIIYYPRNNEIFADYYHYLFRNKSWQKTLGRLGRGIMELRESIKAGDLKIEPVPIPMYEEQKKITKYLDEKTISVDQIINKKEKQIELLKERCTVFINRTILDTKGDLVKIKNHVQVNPTKKAVSTTNLEDLVSFVPMEAISEDGKLEVQEKKYKEVKDGFTYFRNGDVVLAKITPCYENGKAGVMKGLNNGFGFGTTEFMVLRPKDSILADYLYYLIFSDKFRKSGEVEMHGTAGQKRVTSAFVRNYEFTLPSIEKQKEVIEKLNKKTELFNIAIKKTEQSIEILKEFKSSLISNVVTGKVKV